MLSLNWWSTEEADDYLYEWLEGMKGVQDEESNLD
jgi:hypothetical protein